MSEGKSEGKEYGEYRRHYSEPDFWRKVGGMPRDAGRAVVEKAVTLYVILTASETPLWARALVVGALGYFICPLDAIPDVIPVVGYADDVAVMALVLTQLDRFVTPAMRGRVQRLLPEGMRTKPTDDNERRIRRHEQIEHEGSGTGGESRRCDRQDRHGVEAVAKGRGRHHVSGRARGRGRVRPHREE